MNPEINAILVGVKDIDQSKKFYAEGLGCPIEQDYPGYVMFGLGGGSRFGLYKREALAADAGVAPEGSGFTGVTFHHFVSGAQQVDDSLAQAKKAGAKIVKPAQKTPWGYFGYFADPDGHLWKVAASGG